MFSFSREAWSCSVLNPCKRMPDRAGAGSRRGFGVTGLAGFTDLGVHGVVIRAFTMRRFLRY